MTEVNFAYQPFPVHAPFHASAARERFLFGAFGSGKTYAICAEAIAWCLEYPGIRGLITRHTIPELRDTTETVFFELLPVELYQAGEVKRSGGHVESFTFPNGSVILFRGIDDWQKHKSLNVGFIAWDEADEFDEETYMGMSSRIRQREPTPMGRRYGAKEITRRGMWSACNPAGHNWLYRRAVDPATKTPGVAFWRSTSFDNPFLPIEYLEGLLQYPEQWVRRYVLCQFDDFAGQIYESWGWDTHTVEPFTDANGPNPYPSQVFWMGFDPGTRDPSAGLWVVVSDRMMIGVAEYQEHSLAAVRHAAAWRMIEAKQKMKVRWRVADPNSINIRDRGTNMTLSDQYRRLGFNFQLGPSRTQDRIPMLGQLIEMGRFKLTRNCPQTYEAIKDYKWEDISAAMRQKGADPPDRPLHHNTHLVDCAQYLSSRWVSPPSRRVASKPKTLDEEIWATVKQNIRNTARPRINDDLGTLV